MFSPRVKRVIFLFMQGGPSHVDTFDFKAELLRRDGQEIDFYGSPDISVGGFVRMN